MHWQAKQCGSRKSPLTSIYHWTPLNWRVRVRVGREELSGCVRIPEGRPHCKHRKSSYCQIKLKLTVHELTSPHCRRPVNMTSLQAQEVLLLSTQTLRWVSMTSFHRNPFLPAVRSSPVNCTSTVKSKLTALCDELGKPSATKSDVFFTHCVNSPPILLHNHVVDFSTWMLTLTAHQSGLTTKRWP